jgi:predicted ATP-dependent serine protease
MKKQKRLYPCNHCGKNWSEWYLADLCFKCDMENLTKQKDDKPDKQIPGSKKQSGSKQFSQRKS